MAFEPTFREGLVPRESVFITTKLWGTDHRPSRVKPALKRMLKDLRLDYVDLLLIHWPVALVSGSDTRRDGGVSMVETWRAMEALVAQGLVKGIGVSNFNVGQLRALIRHAHIPPAVNQVELHPYLPQSKVVAFCREHSIQVVGYSPLGKTPAQALIKWALQKGVVSIPKSVQPHRIEENFAVWHWHLNDIALMSISAMKETPWRYITGEKWFKPKQTVQEFWDDEY
jgi:alcohol dehydrogenase (NADP+)